MNMRSASAGIVCSMAMTDSSSCPALRNRAASTPIGTPRRMAAPTGISTRIRWSSVRATISLTIAWPPRIEGESVPRKAAATSGTRLPSRSAMALSWAMRRPSIRPSSASRSRIHVRGNRSAITHARQQHRGVVGKEPPVVLEEAKLQALELTVRREDVHDVDLARGQRAIRERVLHHGDAAQAQAVVALEPGPPVLALEEARAEGGAQIRMPGEVADGPQAQALGLRTPDRQGIGIGEAQRGTHGQALGFEPGADRICRGERRVLQDHAPERARVLRIEIDGPGRERAIRDARAAEARVPLDARLSHRFDDLGRDLGQDIALGEGLRSDADDAVRRRARAGWSEEQHHQDERVEDQRAARPARPSPSHGVSRRPARASQASAR